MLLPAELWSYTLVASNISSSGRIWSQFGFLFICYLFIHLIKVVISLFSKQFWRNTLVKTNCFLYLQQTIGAAFGAKKVTVGNKCVTLGIWVSYLFILQYNCSPIDHRWWQNVLRTREWHRGSVIIYWTCTLQHESISLCIKKVTSNG